MYHPRSTTGDGVKQAGKARLKLGIEVKVIDEVSPFSYIVIRVYFFFIKESCQLEML